MWDNIAKILKKNVKLTHFGCFPHSSVSKEYAYSRETWVWFLGQKGPLEKEMATHSSRAWRIPWTEDPGRLQSMGSQESDTT